MYRNGEESANLGNAGDDNDDVDFSAQTNAEAIRLAGWEDSGWEGVGCEDESVGDIVVRCGKLNLQTLHKMREKDFPLVAIPIEASLLEPFLCSSAGCFQSSD